MSYNTGDCDVGHQVFLVGSGKRNRRLIHARRGVIAVASRGWGVGHGVFTDGSGMKSSAVVCIIFIFEYDPDSLWDAN